MTYLGVTLKATYGPVPEDHVKVLENCVPIANLSGDQDGELFFKIVVPSGQEQLKINIAGGTGDADLYVKKGEKPTAKSYDYRPSLHGNDEMVEIQNPAAATWYDMVRGYQTFAGVTLQACYKTSATSDGDDCGCTIYFP
jgi:hypothetical protein